MTTSGDHYEVLGVGRDADGHEIKRAFFRLLKEYPPEQKPTEYQRIREVYDTLSDPASRKEYDGLSEFGDEIGALRAEAEALLHSEPPDLDAAIRALKKAIVLGPEIGYLRNQLGQCLLEAEQPDSALKQFDRATQINPDSPAFALNVARAQRATGDVVTAEATFREVWSRDEEDYAAPRALASLLFDQERKQEAHQVLDKAIGADGKVDFQDFFCLWDKLHFYLFGGDHDELPGVLDTIRHVARSEADRKYAAFMLSDAASYLFDLKVYDKADMFLQSAKELAPDEEAVRQFADNVGEVAGLDASLQAVLDDDSYHGLVQEIVRVRLAFYLHYIDEATAEAQFDEVFSYGDHVLRTDPDARKAKSSARRLRREHPEVADMVDHFLKTIEEAPEADRYRGDCPNCREVVIADKWQTGVVGCPHCHRDFHFDGKRYSNRTSQSTSTYASANSAPQAGGCLVVLVVSTLASLAAIGATVSFVLA